MEAMVTFFSTATKNSTSLDWSVTETKLYHQGYPLKGPLCVPKYIEDVYQFTDRETKNYHKLLRSSCMSCLACMQIGSMRVFCAFNQLRVRLLSTYNSLVLKSSLSSFASSETLAVHAKVAGAKDEALSNPLPSIKSYIERQILISLNQPADAHANKTVLDSLESKTVLKSSEGGKNRNGKKNKRVSMKQSESKHQSKYQSNYQSQKVAKPASRATTPSINV